MMLLEDVGMSLDDCAVIREVLSRVGDRWSVLVVCLLREGPKRFSELRRANIGISQRMLTLTLRGLERDGLVIRTVSTTAPRRVDYALSPLGRTLLTSVLDLAAWANTNRDEIYIQQPNGWSCGPTTLAMATAAWGLRPANVNTVYEMIAATVSALNRCHY